MCSRDSVPTGQFLRDQPHDGLLLLRLRPGGETFYLECKRVAHHHTGPLGATISSHQAYLEPELERPVCRQVVAGPRNQPR
jgi:hypothetical protein